MKNILFVSAGLFMLWFASCKGFSNDVTVDLPNVESKLFVECYLERGKPFRLNLTESRSYFTDLTVIPWVDSALVEISYNTGAGWITSTLQPSVYTTFPGSNTRFPASYVDISTGKFYNFGSSDLCPTVENTQFRLRIVDRKGRMIEGATSFLPIVPIDSLVQLRRLANQTRDTSTSVIAWFKDPAVIKNYYYITTNRNTMLSQAKQVSTFADNVFDGSDIPFGGPPAYKLRDTFIVSVYNMEQSGWEFLRTSRQAVQSNGNPFALPTNIKSNVTGGKGVFTTLNYSRDSLIIQ